MLIIVQILPALRLEIAGRAGVDPFEVSLALLVQYLPEYAYTGQDPVTVLVTQGRALGFIRPSRRTRIRAHDPPQVWPPFPETRLVGAGALCGRPSHFPPYPANPDADKRLPAAFCPPYNGEVRPRPPHEAC